MIRRVLTHPTPYAPAMAALPPGTPVTGPLRAVYIDGAGVSVSQIPVDALVSSDGRPLASSGGLHWGQLAAAGRLQ